MCPLSHVWRKISLSLRDVFYYTLTKSFQPSNVSYKCTKETYYTFYIDYNSNLDLINKEIRTGKINPTSRNQALSVNTSRPLMEHKTAEHENIRRKALAWPLFRFVTQHMSINLPRESNIR